MSESTDEVTVAEALFASDLQASDPVSAEVLRRTVDSVLSRDGEHGCVACMAYEFGEHPDTAVSRMRWARRVVRGSGQSPADATA